jgi:hypothetical protein
MSTSTLRSLIVSLLAATATAPTVADDARPPQSPPAATLDGTVKLKGGSVAAGIGYKWGHGTLTYQGQELQFCIRGLSVGDVGAVSLDARGSVYNLKSSDDFSGKYFALSGGFAIARGESATILKNRHGVMMQLEQLETGVHFNIAANGLRIVMASRPGCKAH